MKNEFKGEINLEVFFRTFWFAFLTLLAVLLEIILLPILFILWLISAGKYNIFIKTTKIIIGKGIYLLFTLNLKDFRKNLREIEKKKNPRIYILNHSSIFDIILLFSLPDCVKILVKESYT
ncbi:MAG TPA: hypothetical protein PLO89_06440 [Spirochaetota bacterium]|nr:hypothetical protein [Spirochaetota bacterium]